ncbi:hypothetical protein [Streptomyces sp. H27-C3]|uniref:hypothetical protein n=1 Tax=Streptomyces sp. H27-C3 TaxID=3046305 RepID=UPI0024BB5C5A|nr:hypothetical protein [Streptomyces sp. H27-C3]MDJ0463134.1 hypothetical protein [Streptomyces sp. H27-C3]
MASRITVGLRELWLESLIDQVSSAPAARVERWYALLTHRLWRYGGVSAWLECLDTAFLTALQQGFAASPSALLAKRQGAEPVSVWVGLLKSDPPDTLVSGADLVANHHLVAAGYAPQRLLCDGGLSIEPDGTVSVVNSNLLVFGPFTGAMGSAASVTHLAIMPGDWQAATGMPLAYIAADTVAAAAKGDCLMIPPGALRIEVPAGLAPEAERVAMLQATVEVPGLPEPMTGAMRQMSKAIFTSAGLDGLLYQAHDDVITALAAEWASRPDLVSSILSRRSAAPRNYQFATTKYLRLLTSAPAPNPSLAQVTERELVATGYMPQIITLTGAGASATNPSRLTFGAFTDLDGSGQAVTHIAVTSNAATGRVMAVLPLTDAVKAKRYETLSVPENLIQLGVG